MQADYWTRIERPDFEKIFWNIPEQKTGDALVLGGNSGAFATEIRSAEFLNSLPLCSVEVLFPDALRGKIPPVPGVNYAPSTVSGSFAGSAELEDAVKSAGAVLLSGDFSKNSATAIAVLDALKKSVRMDGADPAARQAPLVVARDAVDMLAPDFAALAGRPDTILAASMLQLQKIFRSLLYPKMLMLSSPLFPVVETLHKFTLSYPLTILTFQEGNIIIASAGRVATVRIEQTGYVPLSLWAGTLACKILALNLWNPGQAADATAAALFWRK